MPHGVKNPKLQRADDALAGLLEFIKSQGAGNHASPGRRQAEEPPVMAPSFVVEPAEGGASVAKREVKSSPARRKSGGKSSVVSKMQRRGPMVAQRDIEAFEIPPDRPRKAAAVSAAPDLRMPGVTDLVMRTGRVGDLPDEPGAAALASAANLEELEDVGDGAIWEYALSQPDLLREAESGELDIMGLLKALRARRGKASPYPPGV